MTFTYPAIFMKNKYGYNVCFPDCEDLAITGANLEYAREFAAEDLRAWILTQLETHQTLPKATPLADLDASQVVSTLALDFVPEQITKEDISVEL